MRRLLCSLAVTALVAQTLQLAPALAQQARIIQRDAPMYLEPGALEPILQLEAGVVVSVLRVEGEWLRVSVEGSRWGTRTGYIHSRYLLKADPPKPSTASAPPTVAPTPTAPRPTTNRAPDNRGNRSAELTASALFALNRDSVVTVNNTKALGSGVIVDPSGLIITNLHVIAQDNIARITLANGRQIEHVMVAGVDATRDLILLKVNAGSLPSVQLGESTGVAVGERVYAIGSPKGLELSLSDGIVSAVRDVDGDEAIQTTAAISPGSSGGGLFNSRGELIGITTFKVRGGENINFAMPVRYVRPLIASAEQRIRSIDDVYREQRTAQSRPDEPESAPSISDASIPRLAVSYRSVRSGGMLIARQRGDTATITIYNSSAFIVGSALVQWNAGASSFRGQAEVRYLCGSFDTRTITLTSDIAFSPGAGGILIETYARPTSINCSRGQFRTESVQDRWWPNQ